MDPAELRLQQLHQARAVPVRRTRPAGSTTPATTSRPCGWPWSMAGYDELRREQAEKRARGELMGIGVAFFTETVGAGPRKHMDIVGLGMADGAELRVHPTGKAVVRHLGADPGPGARDDVRADRRRGARHPARGHRGRARRHRPDAVRAGHVRQSRSTPVSGGAVAMVTRKVRDKAQADRRGDARGAAGGPGVGEGPLVRQGRPERGQDHPGDRAGRARHRRAARGRRRQPRRRGRPTTRPT